MFNGRPFPSVTRWVFGAKTTALELQAVISGDIGMLRASVAPERLDIATI